MFPLSERLLRHVWEHRLFRTDTLHTADGRPVVILHPGRFNDDAGPDYTGARIRIGSVTYHGDVELHLCSSSWAAHGHTTDPHYNSVVLHVVLDDDGLRAPAATASRRRLPLLVLRPYLDPSFAPVVDDAYGIQRGPAPLPCTGATATLSAGRARRWLETLAAERIELKVRRFDERLREMVEERRTVLREPFPRYYGNPSDIPPPQRGYTRREVAERDLWEQLLYEGLLEGLGYAKNIAPFAQLARTVPLSLLRRVGWRNREATMALLFGAAGLLPSTRRVQDADARRYLRPLRKAWRSLRPLVKGPLVHEGEWRFFRLRPSNFPTSRLAAAHAVLPVLFDGEGLRALIRIVKNDTLAPAQMVRRCVAFFRENPEGFWQYHYMFGCRTQRSVGGLGVARIHELLVNVLFPVLLLYARVFNDPLIRSRVLETLRVVPRGHAIPEAAAVERALNTTAWRPAGAYFTQGAIHLYRLYCAPRRCGECEIGRLLPVSAATPTAPRG
jgi:hypothetical protein